jgi:hypothetical protein
MIQHLLEPISDLFGNNGWLGGAVAAGFDEAGEGAQKVV